MLSSLTGHSRWHIVLRPVSEYPSHAVYLYPGLFCLAVLRRRGGASPLSAQMFEIGHTVSIHVVFTRGPLGLSFTQPHPRVHMSQSMRIQFESALYATSIQIGRTFIDQA